MLYAILGFAFLICVVVIFFAHRDAKKNHLYDEETIDSVEGRVPYRKKKSDADETGTIHVGSYPPEGQREPTVFDKENWTKWANELHSWGAMCVIFLFAVMVTISALAWKEDAEDCSLKTGYNLKSIPGKAWLPSTPPGSEDTSGFGGAR